MSETEKGLSAEVGSVIAAKHMRENTNHLQLAEDIARAIREAEERGRKSVYSPCGGFCTSSQKDGGIGCACRVLFADATVQAEEIAETSASVSNWPKCSTCHGAMNWASDRNFWCPVCKGRPLSFNNQAWSVVEGLTLDADDRVDTLKLKDAMEQALEVSFGQGRKSAEFTIGLVMECRQEALDENVRLRAILSPDQQTCMDRNNLTVAQITSDWEDLRGLEPKALRERLSSRALFFNKVQCDLEDLDCMGTDADDRVLLCDLINDKERNCTMEADRLWQVYLDELADRVSTDDPNLIREVYAEVGAQYGKIVVQRAWEKRAREAAAHPGFVVETPPPSIVSISNFNPFEYKEENE